MNIEKISDLKNALEINDHECVLNIFNDIKKELKTIKNYQKSDEAIILKNIDYKEAINDFEINYELFKIACEFKIEDLKNYYFNEFVLYIDKARNIIINNKNDKNICKNIIELNDIILLKEICQKYKFQYGLDKANDRYEMWCKKKQKSKVLFKKSF